MTEFTAADAQKIYLTCSSGEYAAEYNKIIEAIKEAALKGRQLNLWRAVSAPVKEKLEKNGFTVKYTASQYDGEETTIWW